ncbi:hypothetical protein GUI43_00195 [Micromonospora noduli]|uniref:Uncharacterized protein n=1 Tax=Micromonospora noduli TaxID=709876 RepID=A0ABX9D922_9ACTN|nr:hypothetical protein LUPAC07_06106 [Micromonospora noduli]RAO20755.1 hypothetical protein GUI43_00195 [Micromonospora noduli]RAO24204.1 hypothetical protein ONO86_06600 [Micromonospora noduli]RAO25058.1 hypothetical protein MED15_00816 [Micromonospora noduli]
MTGADRFAGPLAAALPAVDVTGIGPAGEVVRTMQELSPHEAFLGGPP